MPARPNLLFIMTDQQSAATLPSYGNAFAKAPNLTRLSGEGVQWDWAFVQQPVCVPSRVTMHTGRYPQAHRSRGNGAFMGTDEESLPKVLRNAGYKLALAGKNHCFLPDELATWDYVYEVDHQGPLDPADRARLQEVEKARVEVYRRRAVSYATLPYPKEAFGTFLVRDAALRFLERDHDAPFFLWLSFPDPHPPYVIPEEYRGAIAPGDVPLPPREPNGLRDKPARQWFMSRMMEVEKASCDELRECIATYYTMIKMIDDALGDIFEALKARGLDENTLIVFVSDHGDFAGRHQMFEKGPALYDCLVRVPLIFRWPGRLEPRRIPNTMIESVDIMPTILDLLGIEGPPAMQGRSAVPVMTGEASSHKDRVFALAGSRRGGQPVSWENAANIARARLEEHDQNPECRMFRWIPPERERGVCMMVRTLEWKYVQHPHGEGELYHLSEDPDELVNRIDDPACAGVLSRLRAELIDLLIEAEDPRMPAGFDPDLYRSGRVRP